jgi:hypothetical protein
MQILSLLARSRKPLDESAQNSKHLRSFLWPHLTPTFWRKLPRQVPWVFECKESTTTALLTPPKMNVIGGQFGQPPPWQEHKTPDGRAYFYNAITKVTQWTKPEDLMTPGEV